MLYCLVIFTGGHMANIIIICIPVNEFSWRTRAETPDGAVLAVSSVEDSREAALGKLARQNPQLFGIKDIRETPRFSGI